MVLWQPHITQCGFLLQFFESSDDDLNPLSEEEYLRGPDKSLVRTIKEGVDKVKQVRGWANFGERQGRSARM